MNNSWEAVWEKYRIRISQAGGLVLILIAPPRSNLLFLVGFLLAVAGEGVRIWASGHIRKGTELAREGPYAMVRHPLYFGSFVMSAGFALICTSLRHWLKSGIIWAAVLGTFYYLYPAKMASEERDLEIQFKESFHRYRTEVPSFWPEWRLWRRALETTRWNLTQSIRNKEHKTVLALAGLVLLLRIKMVYFR